MQRAENFECSECKINYMTLNESEACLQSHCSQSINVGSEKYSEDADNKKRLWSDKSIRILLEMVDKKRGSKTVWPDIWLHMRQHIPEITQDQVRNRWRHMVEYTRKYDKQICGDGKKKKKPPYYDEVQEILQKHPLLTGDIPSEIFVEVELEEDPDPLLPVSPEPSNGLVRKQPWTNEQMDIFLDLVHERYHQLSDRSRKKNSVWKEIYLVMQHHIPDTTIEQVSHKWRNLLAAVRRYDGGIGTFSKGRMYKPYFYDKAKEILKRTCPDSKPSVTLSTINTSQSGNTYQQRGKRRRKMPSSLSYDKKTKIILPKNTSTVSVELAKLRAELSTIRMQQEEFQRDFRRNQEKTEQAMLEALKSITQFQEARAKTEQEQFEVFKSIAKSLEEINKKVEKK